MCVRVREVLTGGEVFDAGLLSFTLQFLPPGPLSLLHFDLHLRKRGEGERRVEEEWRKRAWRARRERAKLMSLVIITSIFGLKT